MCLLNAAQDCVVCITFAEINNLAKFISFRDIFEGSSDLTILKSLYHLETFLEESSVLCN
jgi:hypothetical protein